MELLKKLPELLAYLQTNYQLCLVRLKERFTDYRYKELQASLSGNSSSKEKGRKEVRGRETIWGTCSNVSYEEWVISTDTYFEEAS